MHSSLEKLNFIKAKVNEIIKTKQGKEKIPRKKECKERRFSLGTSGREAQFG